MRSVAATSCLDENQLAAYLEARLTAAERDRVESHLDRCPSCRSAVLDASDALGNDELESAETHEEPDTEIDPRNLKAGDWVDHFRIKRLLGKGGMGEVFLARDTKLGRKVALKVIRPSLAGERGIAYRFQLEARTTAKFNHPNIVTIFAVGEHGGQTYVALEYVAGMSLRERLDDAPLPQTEARSVCLSIARALEVAHGHGVLHRDLKPANVLLGRDGIVRVVDFGMAKVVAREAGTDSTVSGWVDAPTTPDGTDPASDGGTPAYMAPEQWRGQPPRTAADLWALGVMGFEMLTGRRPFVARRVVDMCALISGPDRAPPLASLVDVPVPLALVIDGCLEKDPARRPTAAEVAAVLGP